MNETSNAPGRSAGYNSSETGETDSFRMTVASIKTAYRRYAKVYDVLFGQIFQPGRLDAIEMVNTRSDQRILEVGVGTGLALPIYRRDAKVTGIDLSPEMLAKARDRVARGGLENVEALLEMNAEQMDFPDASFDCVFAVYVASVVRDLGKLVSEMQRVCVPGGDIVIVNHFATENGFMSKIERSTASLSALIGFKPDLPYADLERLNGMELVANHRANLLGYWKILHYRNAGIGMPPSDPDRSIKVTRNAPSSADRNQ